MVKDVLENVKSHFILHENKTVNYLISPYNLVGAAEVWIIAWSSALWQKKKKIYFIYL